LENKKSVLVIVFVSFALVALVAALSHLSMSLWGGKPETAPVPSEIRVRSDMTIEEFAAANALSDETIQKMFAPASKDDLKKRLSETGLSLAEVADRAKKSSALEHEEGSKNWKKIAAKFAGWAVFLFIVFRLLRAGRIGPKLRLGLLGAGVFVFGVVLGSDPSPMGTVKDAIVLFARSGAVFPPRLVAFLVMLVGGTIVLNKFLCSWGCQFGTLQDLLFRLNRNPGDTKGVLPQFKVPFAVSNSVRIVFLAAVVAVAFLWGADIVEPIDPFKVFNPAKLLASGVAAVAALLAASLFVYRPWCHFFCPFGLAGWLAEKASIWKIKVDYSSCTACGACEKACPSSVMGAILKRDRTIPDCFACGTCVGVCPTKSITFGRGKRNRPPEGKFRP